MPEVNVVIALPSPLQRDIIRAIAFIAMVGDHLATAFSLDIPLLHVLGRCAFPLFAFVTGCNLAGRCVWQSSVNRLWLMAVVAQPFYWLALREAGMLWWQLNILFTFAVVLQGAVVITRVPLPGWIAWGGLLSLYLPLSGTSYGLAGVVMLSLALGLWQVPSPWRGGLGCVWLASVLLLNWHNGALMMASGLLLSLVVLYSVSVLVPVSSLRLGPIGRWFALGYAGHLALISVAVLL